MTTLDLTRASAPEFIARLEGIEREDQRQWGIMGPEKVLRHLNFMLELSLGEVDAEKVFVPVPRFLLWHVFFHWFTVWPRGRFQAPESFFPDEVGDLDEARSTCVAAVHRFVDQLEATPEQTGFSPLLGHITLTKWSRVHGVHMGHHLRQYGV